MVMTYFEISKLYLATIQHACTYALMHTYTQQPDNSTWSVMYAALLNVYPVTGLTGTK